MAYDSYAKKNKVRQKAICSEQLEIHTSNWLSQLSVRIEVAERAAFRTLKIRCDKRRFALSDWRTIEKKGIE